MASHSKARAHDWAKQPMSLKEVDTSLSIIIAMGMVEYPTIRYKKYTLHIHFHIMLTSKLLECTSLGVTGVRSGHLLI